MAFANDSYYEELQKKNNERYFAYWKEEKVWNQEAGWMTDIKFCVSLAVEVKEVCIWHFRKNYFDFVQ